MVRLDKYLSEAAGISRKDAALLLKKGKLKDEEGIVHKDASEKVEETRTFFLDEKPLVYPEANRVYAFYKGSGIVSSRDERDGIPVFSFFPKKEGEKLHAVGRLDKDTTGLLLLTTDGAFTHKILSPKKGHWKYYSFRTEEAVPDDAGELFLSGTLLLNGEETACLPAHLYMTSEREGRLALQEGRYHQVKRMLAAVGAPVLALHRYAMGNYRLSAEQEANSFRILNAKEKEQLTAPFSEEILQS